MKHLRLLLALWVLAIVAACGLPEDPAPRIIAAGDAPLALGDATTPTSTDEGPGATSVQLWFVDPTGDATVLRPLDRALRDTTPAGVFRTLLDGILADDPFGVTTAIPIDTQLLGAGVDGTTAVINLGPAGNAGIFAIGGDEQKTAFGQLVFTALELPGVDSVRFEHDGEPFDAPSDNGTKSPVTDADYPSLDPGRR